MMQHVLKNKISVTKITFLILILIAVSCSKNNQPQKVERKKIYPYYYHVMFQSVKVYGEPDVTSKVVTHLNWCTKYSILKRTSKYIKKTMNSRQYLIYFYKIKIADKTGYVLEFDVYRKKIIENKKFQLNDKPFTIIGKWWMHCCSHPNKVFVINKNKTFRIEKHLENKTIILNKGSYVYDGINKLTLTFKDNRKKIISIVKSNQETTIKYDCFVFQKTLYRNNALK